MSFWSQIVICSLTICAFLSSQHATVTFVVTEYYVAVGLAWCVGLQAL